MPVLNAPTAQRMKMNDLIAKINKHGHGVIMRQIITREFSLWSARDTYVPKANEGLVEIHGRKYIKKLNQLHKHEGKWRVCLSNDDMRIGSWDGSVVVDTPEEGLQILLDRLETK